MNLLSLYSKIQLKIEEVKEEVAIGKKEVKLPIGSLTSRAILKLRFLFWETLRLVVRFFALLFNRSNFPSACCGVIH